MAYIINKTNGEALLTLQDGTVDASTSVQLVGRNYVGYGEIQNENFLFLLENFADDAPPPRPLEGQTWYDTENNVLSVWDGSNWATLGAATIQLTEPTEPTNGTIWLKETYNSLYVYNGEEWILIGPESIEGYGKTRAESTILFDINDTPHPVIMIQVDDTVCGIISSTDFSINATSNPVAGLEQIKAGINVPSSQKIQGYLYGTAKYASQLEEAVLINGVTFTGADDVTIPASTKYPLVAGNYILGGNFNGDSPTEFSVDATVAKTPYKVVVRDLNGDFAGRYITADKFIGQVDAPTGTSRFDTLHANKFVGLDFSGNATTAGSLKPGAEINGVLFKGNVNITIPANAETLTGSFINPTVKGSSLTSLGVLEELTVNQLKIYVESTTNLVTIGITGGPNFMFASSAQSQEHGGANVASLLPINNNPNIGGPGHRLNTVYADVFDGTATAARFADLAEYYSADKEYETGTVLVFGGEQEVTTTTKAADPRVAGVVSADPGFVMNTELAGTRACIALQGRVPVKVIGPVTKGEMLVTSEQSGYAKVSHVPSVGTVIGKSLETNNTKGPTVVEVSVGKM